jgi:hypothetical protein
VEICRKLDGVPLAIELAATRVDALGVKDLAARLDDRFTLLTKGRRTALPRHQTLRATLDWSHDVLSEADRVILRRIAVFRGHFTIEAAAAVATSERITVADGRRAFPDNTSHRPANAPTHALSNGPLPICHFWAGAHSGRARSRWRRALSKSPS